VSDVRKQLPVLRWVGGKQLLWKRLAPLLPKDILDRTYHEPFLGSASLFLAISPKNAVLSDLNPHLIHFYEHVRKNPDLVSKYIRRHQSEDSERYYYAVRDEYNGAAASAAQAARFLYLNRTCFNGVFRVNQKGEFNVPYGKKAAPRFPSLLALRELAKRLKSARLRSLPFAESLQDCKKGEFVYLDPPYPPLNGTSFFTHYTLDRFDAGDQEALATEANRLDSIGALVMLSNADTTLIRRLYRGWRLHSLEVTRFVTCKKKRHQVSELVITNY
jgi:DNA adenine methylase